MGHLADAKHLHTPATSLPSSTLLVLPNVASECVCSYFREINIASFGLVCFAFIVDTLATDYLSDYGFQPVCLVSSDAHFPDSDALILLCSKSSTSLNALSCCRVIG